MKKNLQLRLPKAREKKKFYQWGVWDRGKERCWSVLKKAISKATRTEKAKRSLRELIASITAEQSEVATHSLVTTKKTPKESHVLTLRTFSKRKRAQTSGGTAVLGALTRKQS